MTAFYNQGPYGVSLYSGGNVYNCSGGFTIGFSFAGTADTPSIISGNMPIVLNFGSPNLVSNYTLQASLPINFSLNATLIGVVNVSGGISTSIVMNNIDSETTVHPVWTPADPCPPLMWAPVECDPVDWEAAEKCNG